MEKPDEFDISHALRNLKRIKEVIADDEAHSLDIDLTNVPPWNYTGKQLIPPFTYFGGKRKIADEVWLRFGHDIPNYIEPFAGGLSVLLARPVVDIRVFAKMKYRELVADTNGFLLNFWRAVSAETIDEIVRINDMPAFETQLLSRRKRMMKRHGELVDKLNSSETFHDAELAGYWLYIQRLWIGAGADDPASFPDRKMMRAIEGGILGYSLKEHLDFCSARTRHVRFFHDGWRRPIISSTQTDKIGLTAVFLDPPYMGSTSIYSGKIRADDLDNQAPLESREWAIENGKSGKFRIAYCGYRHHHEEVFAKEGGWIQRTWARENGYRNNSSGKKPGIDTIWFSPTCIPVEDSVIKRRYSPTPSVWSIPRGRQRGSSDDSERS